MSKTTTKNYIKQMVSSETKKSRKGREKQRRSYSSSDSDSSSDEESWRSGMSGVEQMHMLASAGINPMTVTSNSIPLTRSVIKNKPEKGLRARATVGDAESLRLVQVAKLLAR